MIKNHDKIGDRFIQILEVIYAIIMACGVASLIEVLSKYYPEISLKKWLAVFISILVLIRFFFAPSKNVKLLVKKSKYLRIIIMPFDVVILLAHSFLFYAMCFKVDSYERFYFWFFVLIAVNSCWLFSIWLRLRREELSLLSLFKLKIPYILIWAINNFIFVLAFACFMFFKNKDIWVIWFSLALLNSLIDLLFTYPYYFED